jgi:uncharacterized protein involved in tellurium resistance
MPLMVIVSFVRMEVIMNILIGLNWQKRNGHKFTKLQVLRVAVGCAEDLNMTARSIRKRLGGLFGNQWSRLNDLKLNLCINCVGSVFIMWAYTFGVSIYNIG